MVVPEGWRAAERPRTVAVLGWARLSEQGDQGSGYNLSASELASGLAASGHRVLGLSSGMAYSLRPGVRVERDVRWRGVETFCVVNSPCVAPASLNFGNLAAERSSPGLTRAVVAWAVSRGVEVAHIHSLEGFSLDLIPALRAAGLAVVVTLHNYWFVCPQVDLLRGERCVCLDYDGGRACDGCVTTGAAAKKRRRRAVSQALMTVVGRRATDVVRDGLDGAVAVARGREPERPRFTPLSRMGLPLDASAGLEARTDARVGPELRPSLPPDGDRVDRAVDYDAPPADANERLLADPGRHTAGETAFAERRRAGIAALNAASAVLSPSGYVRDVHAAMGVRGELLRHVPLGQPHFDELTRAAKSSRYYGVPPWEAGSATRPLRLAFHGTVRASKGLEVLVRAVLGLERDVLERVHVMIRAMGHDTPARRRLAGFSNVTFEGQYDLAQLVRAAGTYDVGVLSHVWLENSPLVMWEHLHAGKLCVVPRLGGPVGVVREGVNGAVFAPGDPEDLGRVVSELARGERRVPSAREVIEGSELRSYPEHVAAVEGVYEGVL